MSLWQCWGSASTKVATKMAAKFDFIKLIEKMLKLKIVFVGL